MPQLEINKTSAKQVQGVVLLFHLVICVKKRGNLLALNIVLKVLTQVSLFFFIFPVTITKMKSNIGNEMVFQSLQ